MYVVRRKFLSPFIPSFTNSAPGSLVVDLYINDSECSVSATDGRAWVSRRDCHVWTWALIM